MTALKEERCEREPPVDDDDFGGLACPPLDDLEAVVILETMTCDPSKLFDDIKLDERDLAILEKPKKPSHGKGRDLEILRFMLSAPPPSCCQQNPKGPEQSDPHYHPQDWDDEEKLATNQDYQEFQNKGKKIEVIDKRGKFLTSSRKCRAF